MKFCTCEWIGGEKDGWATSKKIHPTQEDAIKEICKEFDLVEHEIEIREGLARWLPKTPEYMQYEFGDWGCWREEGARGRGVQEIWVATPIVKRKVTPNGGLLGIEEVQ